MAQHFFSFKVIIIKSITRYFFINSNNCYDIYVQALRELKEVAASLGQAKLWKPTNLRVQDGCPT